MSINTLLDMCELIVDCPHSTPKWTDSGFTVLRNQAIKKGSLNLKDCSFTDELNFNARIKRAAPKSGDIVITREAPMGEVCKIPDNLICCLGQRQVLLRPKHDVDADYLLYVLQSKKVQEQILWNEGTGSTVSNLRIPVLERLEIPRFGRFEKTIGEILKSLDDKIHLNNQINKTLESIAQAIFKSWFIDFEPVRAKIAAKQEGKDPELAAMCAISGKTQAELDQLTKEDFAELQATAALFPDELVESELGEVPRGWFNTDLSILADLNVQSWTKKNCPEKVTYVDLSNTKWGVIQQTEEFIFENAPSRARRVLKIGDTIVGTVRPANGSYAFIQQENLTGSTGFAVLSPKKEIYAEFIYISSTDEENIKRLAHLADGGAYPAVSYDTVLNTPCILPIETVDNDSILNLFHEKVKGFYLLSASKLEENRILENARDTLLPKLLSGELDVSGLQGEGA